MKKLLSLVLVLTLVLSTFAMLAVSSSAEEVTAIEKGSEWEYLAYEDAATAAPEGWLTGEDTATWSTGTAPFGEGRTTDFGYANYIAYLRTTFTVEDASEVISMIMTITYDENPRVYLNGTQVWGVDGYRDAEYWRVDLRNHTGLLKDGENILCVQFSEAMGGSILDMDLTIGTDKFATDGSIVASSASCEGFANFGDINAPTNILDGDNNSCCGSGWDDAATQAVTITFPVKVDLSKVTVSCKNEGAPAEGAWGTYEIFVIDGENMTETSIGTVDAYPEGRSVELTETVEADAVKVVITSWKGGAWAAIADIWAYGTEIVEEEPDVPVEPTVGAMTIAPTWDFIGNWRNYTWFIVGFSSDAEANADINTKLKDGTYSLKVVITDETGATYTISKYAFDHVDEEWGAVGATHWGHDGSYLRICVSDYGIAPSPEHVYTVAFEITEGETVKHAGTSAEGAFTVNPDNGNSLAWQEAGPIVLDNPPYLYDEAETVEPPVETGDATAFIAVLAVVALFGAAVVTKKVFVK